MLRFNTAIANFMLPITCILIPPGAWMFVSCECCVLLIRGLCDELITRPEESYRFWCVVVCDLENIVNEEALAHWGLSRQKQIKKYTVYIPTMPMS